MIFDYFLIAYRGMKRRKIRSWLTMLGIFIGIAAVISLIGLGEGLRIGITSQFGFLGSDILTIQSKGLDYGVPGSGAIVPLTEDLAKKISNIHNVETAFNRYVSIQNIEFNNKMIIGAIVSIPTGKDKKITYEMLNLKAEKGRMLKDIDDKKIVIGNDFLDDKIIGKAVKVGDSIKINNIKFEVVGILEKKGNFMLDQGIAINTDAMLNELNVNKNEVNIIAAKVKDENKIEKTQQDIEKELRKLRDVKKGEEDFTVTSPQKTLESLNSTLFAVQLFVYIIAIISLLVGGIGIMNTMYTAVLERTKEIGIMKSIGAKNSGIFSIFFIESGLMGTVGGLIGIGIGSGVAYGLAFIGRKLLSQEMIQAHISPTLIIGTLLFSFILGTLFGILPAMRASKLQPVESIREMK